MPKPLKDQKVLCFVPATNSHLKDATGAFHPESAAFLKQAKGGLIYKFDNEKELPGRRAEILAQLKQHTGEGFTAVAFFCHGWMDGMQGGFLRKHVGELAAAIHACVSSKPSPVILDVVVPLYCCSTGQDPQDDPLTAIGTGDDSFADKLRDALCSVGQINCRVMGHTVAAHTTMNPMALFMDGMGVPNGGVGGYPPVSPKSADWKAWKAALANPKSTLRFRMPFMTPAEIHAELAEPLGVA